ADADNALLVDLDNVLSVETFAHLIKGRPAVRLEEVLPGPRESGARGPEGTFAHELLIPFVLKETARREALPPRSPAPAPFARSLHPGSPWLYAKLYAGTSGVDQILRSVVAPLIRRSTSNGAVDQWFFIRFGDPDWHLRLRVHGAPERLRAEFLPE